MKYWRIWYDWWDNLTESKKVRLSKIVILAIIIYFGSILRRHYQHQAKAAL